MPKFKKVIRKQVGGDLPYYEEGPGLFQAFENIRSDMAKDIVSPREAAARAGRMGRAAAAPKIRDLQALSPGVVGGGMAREGIGGAPIGILRQPKPSLSGFDLAGGSISKALAPLLSTPERGQPKPQAAVASGVERKALKKAPMPTPRAVVPNYVDRDMSAIADMMKSNPELMKTMALGLPALPSAAPDGEESELSSMLASSGKGKSTTEGAIPKTKSGLKKFMQDYGKFIALGAMAGAGGKGGRIAAPIIAALPGLIEMMKKRGKKAETKAHGGSMAKKSSGGDTPKKSEGGAIRKFKGGSMNTKNSMLTPKYKKGGNMPKGKAMGEMPQHKKMAMGKPTPQSTGQKFAKGGAAKYAGGGMCKGYGISKKIRPTGPMN